jgi:hypothetical protein
MAEKEKFIRKALQPALDDVAGDRLTGSAVTEHYMREGEEDPVAQFLAEEKREEDPVAAFLAEEAKLDPVQAFLAEEAAQDPVANFLAEERARSTPDERIRGRFTKPKPGGLEDFMVGLERGARQEVLPYSYTSEELDAIRADEYNWSKFIGEFVGGMGGGIAGAVAVSRTGGFIGGMIGSIVPGAGTAVGSAIGAAVSLVGYAVYTGWGSEKIQAELMEIEQSDVRAGARALLNINPAARFGARQLEILRKISPKLEKMGKAAESKTGRRIRGAAQVVGETAVTTTTLDEKSGALAFGISAVISGYIFRRAKGPIGSSTSKALDEFLETEVGQDFANKLRKKQEEIAKTGVDLTEEKLTDVGFMDYLLERPGLGGKGGSKLDLAQKKLKVKALIADEESGGLGQEMLEDIYRSYQVQQAGLEIATEIRDKTQKQFADTIFDEEAKKQLKQFDPFPGFISWFADAQAIARATDRVAGTTTTTVVNKISETRGRFEVSAAVLYKQGLKARKAQRAVRIKGKKMTNEQMGRLRVFFSENNRSALTPELEELIDVDNRIIKDEKLKTAVEEWNNAWEMARNTIQEHGYTLGNIPYYTPLRSVMPIELAVRIKRSGSTLQGVAMSSGKGSMFELTAEDFKKIPGVTKKEVQRFTEELDNIRDLTMRATNKTAEELTNADAGVLIKKLIGKHGENYGFGTELNVIYRREGVKIADKFREYDIGKAYSRYINSQVRTSMFSSAYSELADNLKRLKTMGLNKSAEWFDDHFQDIVGAGEESKWKVANMLQGSANVAKYEIRQFLDKTKLPTGVSDRVAEVLPDIVGAWQANLYSAYLGYNVQATLRNMTQAFATLAPELGGEYGYQKVAASYIRLATRLVKERGWSGIAKELRDKGFSGDIRRSEILQDVPSLGGPIGRGVDLVNQVGMTIYSFADVINRYVAVDVGKQLTKDLIEGNADALSALKKMGKANLAQLRGMGIQEAIRDNDSEKVADALGSLLLAKTQYHYGAEQKARFARFVGPLFSMFSKWPTAQIGNIYDIYKENPGMARKARRYFEVYGAQFMALAALRNLASEEGWDEATLFNYLVGDPMQISPLTAIEFSIMQNPALEMIGYLGGVAKDALESDEPLSGETLKKAISRGTKKILQTSLPPASSALNEIDKYQKRRLGEEETVLTKASEIPGEFLEWLSE